MRLDTVVRIIANSMIAEVCSIYLRRASEELELFATEGLNADAVHKTRNAAFRRPGRRGGPRRGAAEPDGRAGSSELLLPPGNRRDPYRSFLGVPLLRGGRTIGVLVVQNKAARRYEDDEVEDLQIISMVLAEIVTAGELVGNEELKDIELSPSKPERLKGSVFADGIALGVVILHDVPVTPEHLLSDDVTAEEKRLHVAIDRLREQIDEMFEGQHGLAGPTFDVLETYPHVRPRPRLGAQPDRRRQERPDRRGRRRARQVRTARPAEHRRDAYMRERLHDLEDLANRLLRVLAGKNTSSRAIPEDSILVARDLGPPTCSNTTAPD
ncbi:MAG: GAF domain-containing protein [Asticcacaulis sp.]